MSILSFVNVMEEDSGFSISAMLDIHVATVSAIVLFCCKEKVHMKSLATQDCPMWCDAMIWLSLTVQLFIPGQPLCRLFWTHLGMNTESPYSHPQLDLLVVNGNFWTRSTSCTMVPFITLFSGENVCCVNNTRDLCKPLHFQGALWVSANSHNTLVR